MRKTMFAGMMLILATTGLAQTQQEIKAAAAAKEAEQVQRQAAKNSAEQQIAPESDSQWKVESTRDAMTDKASTTASLITKGGQLVVGSGVIVLYVDSWPHQGRTNVQWRIDNDQMVDEYWFASRRLIGTDTPKKLLRAMANGTRLRIRVVDDATTLDFNITGFADVLPKLGMKM